MSKTDSVLAESELFLTENDNRLWTGWYRHCAKGANPWASDSSEPRSFL